MSTQNTTASFYLNCHSMSSSVSSSTTAEVDSLLELTNVNQSSPTSTLPRTPPSSSTSSPPRTPPIPSPQQPEIKNENDEQHLQIKVAVLNARSANKKIEDIIDQLHYRDCNLVCISETWESSKTDREEIEQLHSVTWLSKPRRFDNRGGGCAVVADNSFADISIANIQVPAELELMWVWVRPKTLVKEKLLVGCFYSSGTKKYKPPEDMLQDHVLDVIMEYMARDESIRVLCCGDLNTDDLSSIIDLPGFHNDIDKPTRGPSYLEWAVSNLNLVGECCIHPPLEPDRVNRGKKSDHSIATINYNLTLKKPREWYIHRRRKYNETLLRNFKEEFRMINWWKLLTGSPDNMLSSFHDVMQLLLDKHFKFEEIRQREGDALYYTPSLRRERRRLKKRYKKGGTQKFKEKKRKYAKRVKEAKGRFYNNRFENLKKNPRKYYKEITGLMENGGKRKIQGAPEIIEFKDLKTDLERAEKAADSIAELTQHYDKLDIDEARRLHEGGNLSRITLLDIQQAFQNMKLPHGFHSSDPPREVLRDMPNDLAVPLTIIFNAIVESEVWPEKFKEEETRFIPKKKIVTSFEHLRPIVLTSYYSKVLEHILRKQILQDVTPNLHLGQFGGLQGLSCDHYLMSAYQELAQASEAEMTSVMFTYDFSKAFNLMPHKEVVQSAARLGVRPPLVRLIASYLYERRTSVLWNDQKSTGRHSNGGSGQGTVWSAILFLLTVDGLLRCLEDTIRRLELGRHITSSPRLFCDDLCLILHTKNNQLKDSTFSDVDGRINKLLKVLQDFADKTGMKLNLLKTNATTYNYNRPRLTFPEDCLKYPSGETIPIKDDIRLLGAQVEHDLQFNALVKERRRSGLFATYQLQRLAAQGISKKHLRTVYLSFIRSVTEYGLLSASTFLVDKHWKFVESVQRRCTRIIMGFRPKSFAGDRSPDYDARLQHLGLQRIEHRTKSRFRKFVLDNEFEPRFDRFFSRILPQGLPRRTERPYFIKKPDTDRMGKSPFVEAARILNSRPDTLQERKTRYLASFSLKHSSAIELIHLDDINPLL